MTHKSPYLNNYDGLNKNKRRFRKLSRAEFVWHRNGPPTPVVPDLINQTKKYLFFGPLPL